jgi:hypothetical protein
MTNQVYKTAQGRTIDMGAIKLKHENERAVGNMKVNARGDVVDEANRPIERREQQVRRNYAKNNNLDSSPVKPTSDRSK